MTKTKDIKLLMEKLSSESLSTNVNIEKELDKLDVHDIGKCILKQLKKCAAGRYNIEEVLNFCSTLLDYRYQDLLLNNVTADCYTEISDIITNMVKCCTEYSKVETLARVKSEVKIVGGKYADYYIERMKVDTVAL